MPSSVGPRRTCTPVLFGRGLLNSGYFRPQDGRRFVVTDENVAQAVTSLGGMVVVALDSVTGSGAALAFTAADGSFTIEVTDRDPLQCLAFA